MDSLEDRMLEQIYETADTIRDNINGLNYQQKL